MREKLKTRKQIALDRQRFPEVPELYLGRHMLNIYPEVYRALQKRCKSVGTITLTEYVNRAVAKALQIRIVSRKSRPYYVEGFVNPKESVESVFSLLDLTPIGTTKEGAKKPKKKDEISSERK